MVSAYDVRPAAKEEVQSLGARFVELELDTSESADTSGYAKALAEEKQRRQVELLAAHIAKADVVVTTALIPGREAPLLISKEAVTGMKTGSVIVDLAAPNGGNCELTKPGEDVVVNGVQIQGPLNLPSELPSHASQMYSRTISAMILEFYKDGTFSLDLEDDILKSACVSHGGAVVNERVRGLLGD
jgi:NAD(P) transhydrogenase subunit alpha